MMRVGERIELTLCECNLIGFVAEKRTEHNQAQNIKEQAQSQINEGESLAAEYAFCKLHNLYPDLGWHDRNKEDCQWGGFDVDVKCVSGNYMSIRWNESKSSNDRTMMYCAMRRVNKKSFEFLGYVQGAELEVLGTQRPNNVGDGFYWSVPVNKLRKSWRDVISF